MSAFDPQPGLLLADPSLISPEFIRRLHDQRALYKRQVAFHLAEAEKHGAADEALASMIEAAEKVVAIMFPASMEAADAPDETETEDGSVSPSWTEATMAVVGKAPEPVISNALPATHGLETLRSDDRTGHGANVWRARLLGSRT